MFLGAALIWGASFMFVEVSLRGMSLVQVAWGRTVLGAAALALVIMLRRERLPREPVVWAHFVFIAVFNVLIPHLAFAWGQQFVSSSLASIYNATTPIATAVLAVVVYRVEKLAARQMLGVLIGVLGVVVIIAPWTTTLGGDLRGQIACLVAASSYGVALGYMRRFISPRDIPGTVVGFMSIGTAAVIWLLATPLVVATGPVQLDWAIVGSIVLLGCLGTGIAYVWAFGVLRAWGPTASSMVTYLIPVIGIILGVGLLGETLTWNEPVGALLVLSGILLVQWRRRRRTLDAAVEPAG